MKFNLVMEGPPESLRRQMPSPDFCRRHDNGGYPRQFQAFVRDNAAKGAGAGTTVVIESDGGSVLGALDFGRSIRRFGFATSVGRIIERRGKTGASYGEMQTHADCQSMCPFVLLGGVQRFVPADARVLVHQIWLGDRREDAAAANYTAEDLMVVQRDIGSIMQYTAEMGGDTELVVLSLRAPPWEPMRVLSRDELRRTHLDFGTGGEAVVASAAVATAAGPAPIDEDAERLANGHGWVTIAHDGQVTLARSHPLTIEGDHIGSFDLYLGCGAVPQTYTLTYRETRTGSAERSLPRNITQVAVMIEDQVQTLKLGGPSDRQSRRGQIDSVATAVLPAKLVRALATDGPVSMTVETESSGNPRTRHPDRQCRFRAQLLRSRKSLPAQPSRYAYRHRNPAAVGTPGPGARPSEKFHAGVPDRVRASATRLAATSSRAAARRR